MKKTFLKATLFSLTLAALPAAILTGCKDYDDDIDRLTQRDDEMQKEFNDKLAQQEAALASQSSALQAALDEQKAEAARANAAAEKASQAAAAAQAAADQAQKTGDEAAAAAAKADEAAQTANAQAQAALAAAAQAKADAIAETIAQIDALRTEITGQIDALKKEFGDNYTKIAAAVAKAATKDELNAAVESLKKEIAASKLTQGEIEEMLASYLSQINTNTQTISALSGRIDGIATDINTLRSDLSNLNSQVTTNTGNISKNTADIAVNALAIANETERINQIVNTVIPGIQGQVTGLDSKLSAHISAYNTFKTQTESQIAALETFKSTYESLLSGLNADLQGIKSRLTAAETKLSKAQEDIAQNASEISTINGLITALQNKDGEHDAAISALQSDLAAAQQDINAINSALSTLNAINAKRLTSLTLIPKAYVGGIPTIEFYSASYTPMGVLNKATGFYAAPSATAKPVIVTNNDTKVAYRMNPAGVSLSDIVAANVTFVQQTATSRAAEVPVVKVVKVEKNDEGHLIVSATKADGVTSSIDNAGAGRIYTVALKVPVAPKNYYTWKDAQGKEVKESAEDAVVYSEYSRLAESTFTPEIAAVQKKFGHFWNSSAIYSDDIDPVVEVPYTLAEGEEGFDLTSLVTGCMNDNGEHTAMSAEQLESFGFTFEYSIPSKAYTVNGVNQQIYASVTADGKLTPTNPGSSTAASRVGKTPIVSVVMKHGNQAVDQRFFKVEYVIDAKATTYSIDVFSTELSCNPVSATVTWATLNEAVISKLPFPMNQSEFVKNFNLKAEVTGIVYNPLAIAPAAPISWSVGLDEIANMGGKDKAFTKTLVFESDIFPDVTVKLNGKVSWPKNLPTLGRTDHAYWTNGVMEVTPVAMPRPYDGTTTATYKTNVLSGRYASYINGLLPCADWDIQVKAAPAGFAVGAKAPVMEGNDGYNVVQGDLTAASIWYDAAEHTPFCLTSEDAKGGEDLNKMFFFIENNDAGIELVEKQATIDLGWYIFLNGKEYRNAYMLNNTSLKIRKPLQSLNAGTIAALTQNADVQYRELAEGMTITDCFGNRFSEDSDYWKYYDITSVKWLNDMKITDADGTNERELSALNMEAMVDEETGKLTFTGSGIILQQPIVLNVPVIVTHKWGTLKSIVRVQINPNR